MKKYCLRLTKLNPSRYVILFTDFEQKKMYRFLLRFDSNPSLTSCLKILDSRGVLGETMSDNDVYFNFFEVPKAGDYISKAALEVTSKCNFNCIHCCNSATYQSNSEDLEIKTFEKLAYEANVINISSVSILGGEPLMREDIFDVLRIFRRHYVAVFNLFTNGSLLTKSNLAILCKLPLFNLTLSIDGWSSRSNDFIRQGSDIQKIKSVLMIAKSSGIPITVSTIVTKWCLPELNDMYSELSSIGVNTWILGIPRFVGRASKFKEQIGDNYREILDALSDLRRIHKSRVNSKGLRLKITLPEDSNGYNYLTYPCRYRDTVRIKSDGSVHWCQVMWEVNPRLSRIGDIKRKDLEELLYKDRPNTHLAKVATDRLYECKHCNKFGECGGGCRAFAYQYGGDILGKDPIACQLWGINDGKG